MRPPFWFTNLRYPHQATFLNSRIRDAEKLNDVDILFVGSSSTYRGFDPRLFAQAVYKTMNLGSSSQTPQKTTELLNCYLDRLKPEVVIWEVNPIAFTLDGVECSLDFIANAENIDASSIDYVYETKHPAVLNALLYRLFRNCTGLEKDREDPLKHRSMGGIHTYISRGYVAFNEPMYSSYRNVLQVGRAQLRQDIAWTPRPEMCDGFKKGVRLLKTKGIRAILVRMPTTKHFRERWVPGQDEEFASYFNQFAPFYDINQLVKLDEATHFLDDKHLNQDGVNKVNSYIVEQILCPSRANAKAK